jgi:hypothetical protein
VFADVSMNMYTCQILENEIVDDYINNYMFLAGHNPCNLNTALSLSSENYSEKEVVVIDDQDLIKIELEGH